MIVIAEKEVTKKKAIIRQSTYIDCRSSPISKLRGKKIYCKLGRTDSVVPVAALLPAR